MKIGKLLYKCRLCGEIDDGMRTASERVQAVAWDILVYDRSGPGIPCGRLGMHACKDGREGVTDFVGYEFAEEKP